VRQGDLRVVAAPTPEAWMLATRRRPSICRLFTPVSYFFVKPEQKLASVVMPVLKGKHWEVKFDWTD